MIRRGLRAAVDRGWIALRSRDVPVESFPYRRRPDRTELTRSFAASGSSRRARTRTAATAVRSKNRHAANMIAADPGCRRLPRPRVVAVERRRRARATVIETGDDDRAHHAGTEQEHHQERCAT